MHKNLKRLTSLVLAGAMLTSLSPLAFAEPAEGGGIMPLSGSVDYYVANSTTGGSDVTGNGTKASPYLTISNAIQKAKDANADDVNVILLSDINLTQELAFNSPDMAIYITSDVDATDNYTIQYTGTAAIGLSSGLIKVINNTDVTFDGVNLAGSTGAFDGRVIYVAEGAEVTLQDLSVTDGRTLNAINNNQGGAGALVADQGTLNIGSGVVFSDNQTSTGGGAVCVTDGGTVNIADDASFTGNTAKLGGAIYADAQSHTYGGMNISGTVSITNNTASENGAGIYICADANASIQDAVNITGNKVGSTANNVYLPVDATLDISGATTAANIGITADPEAAYRLVSLPDSYTIQPTASGDEAGWSDDCDTWDIRYMEYNGVPGLYLYYKALDMTFEDVDTLTSVAGKNINGEATDFLTNSIPGSTNVSGVLTVPDVAAKGSGEDLVITFTCDPDEYRIPTEDVVSITSGGSNVAFTYVPDFEHGTATITIDDAVVDTLTDTIAFEITAEKYYNLTVRMEGPLYAMTTDITGLSENVLDVSSNTTGTDASYTIERAGVPLSGVVVELYEEDTAALAANTLTGADGVASFTGLNASKSYYPVLKYQETYRVITRDEMSLDLSTLAGQTLASTYISDAYSTVTYNASTGEATISNVIGTTTVTFSVDQAKDTITFMPNEGDATSAPATLSMTSKEMPAGATTYGTLATASLTGYDFDGWFTAAEGGTEVQSTTAYTTGTSPRVLYAHWTARTDTAYKIQHWVEYAEGDVNVGYEAGVTGTKVYNGVTYYLYETSDYADGTSDAVQDITSLDLSTMSDSTYTWWTRSGFTASYQENCKVLANGTSVFSIYYDRNAYEISFETPVEEGTASNDDDIPAQNADFGAKIGTLPTPTLPGYDFAGWYDGAQLVNADTIYNKTEGTKLTAHWNAKNDTKWAIKIAVQDIKRDANGVCSAANTWTEYKTVFKDNNGNLLVGTTDTTVNFNVADIDELSIPGFNYVGYAETYQQTDPVYTASSTGISVYVDPTDASTLGANGRYNEAFDGGIVWLYYTRKTATVSFPNTETPDPDDKWGEDSEIIYGGDFTGQLPDAPGKDGYDFSGWADPANNIVTEETLADEYVKNSDELVLHPTWTARTYHLTYVPGTGANFVATNGSAGTVDPNVEGGYVDPKLVTYDQQIGTMARANKLGYTFDGWFLADGVTQIKEDTVLTVDNVVISNAPTYSYEDTRPLYAKYTPHAYTLKFHAGESSVTHEQGSVSPDTMSVTYDSAVGTLPTPTLTGYRFVGWYLDLEDPSTLIQTGDIWNYAYANGATIHVYANWVPNSYQYTFNMNDASEGKGSTFGMLVDTSIDHTEEIFDSVYDGIFEVEATRPGYIFEGWALNADAAKNDVLTAADLVAIAHDTTVYAVWTPKEYDVKFIMKGAEMPADFTTGNPEAVQGVDGNWTIKVKFDTTYGTLPVPVKTDCQYNGWLAAAPNWDAIDNEIILTLPSYVDYKDTDGIVLTAVMEPYITFNPSGNTFVGNATLGITEGSTDPKKILQSDITELPEVGKDNYVFDGWAEEGTSTILTLDQILALEEPTVLVPVLSAEVTFDANGGTIRTNNAATLTVGLSRITVLPSAIRSSYNQTGWFTAAEGGTQVTLDSLRADNVPTTVYAHWTYAGAPSGGGGGGGGIASFIITATADEGATITPSGKVSVSAGADKEFTFEALAGYVISDVLVDGESVKADGKYIFENVSANHTIEIKVKAALTDNHIAYIVGYDDGMVHPEANITRAEVAMIFYRLLTDEARAQYETTYCQFPDVNVNAWYGKAVATLTNMGIITGASDGKFHPGDNITRAEFATIAARFDSSEYSGEDMFGDISGHWAANYINRAAVRGWVHGSNGLFRPNADITRAETMTLVNNVLGRSTITEDSLLEDMIEWPDNMNTDKWYYLAVQEATNGHNYNMTDGVEMWTALK